MASQDRARLAGKRPPPRDSDPGWLSSLEPRSRRMLAMALVGIAAAVFLIDRHVASRPTAFPTPVGPPPVNTGTELAAPRLAAKPAAPTVVGLTVGGPRPLPGLQGERGVSSPTLSSDLKTIVYVLDQGPRGGGDLMASHRAGSHRAFSSPTPLEKLNTSGDERLPSLSRDGLELLFTRDGRPLAAERPTLDADFGAPVPLDLVGFDPEVEVVDDLHLSTDDLHVIYRVTARDPAAADRQRYLRAFRIARGQPFEPPETLGVWRAWASNTFSADALRNYAGDGGLSVSSRIGLNDAFGTPGLIQTATPGRVGPIVGPFWLAPKEDMVVYSSPGTPRTGKGKARDQAGAEPRLWMVQFR